MFVRDPISHDERACWEQKNICRVSKWDTNNQWTAGIHHKEKCPESNSSFVFVKKINSWTWNSSHINWLFFFYFCCFHAAFQLTDSFIISCSWLYSMFSVSCLKQFQKILLWTALEGFCLLSVDVIPYNTNCANLSQPHMCILHDTVSALTSGSSHHLTHYQGF